MIKDPYLVSFIICGLILLVLLLKFKINKIILRIIYYVFFIVGVIAITINAITYKYTDHIILYSVFFYGYLFSGILLLEFPKLNHKEIKHSKIILYQILIFISIGLYILLINWLKYII